MKPDTSFSLGQFMVVPSECAIKDQTNNTVQVLQPKFIDVLSCLAAHYPNLVSRDVLIDTLWDGNYPVGEKALTNAIWNLRQQFKPQDDQPIIETIRKRGYRLLVTPQYHELVPLPSATAPIPELASTIPANDSHGATTATGSRFKNWSTPNVVATLMSAILLLITVMLFNHHDANDGHSDQQQFAPQISHVTTDPGREYFPVVSPDGHSMVYVWQRIGQNADLYLKNLNHGDILPRQLTFTDKIESRPIWKRDGSGLYFVEKSWDRNHCQIMSLTLASNKLQQVTPCPANNNISLSLSADGKTLGFIGNSDGYANVGIYFLDLTAAKAQPVRFSCGDECQQRDRNFAFSPDGKHIAVSRRVGSLIEDIFIVNLQTNHSRQLTFGEGDIIGLAWHPKGDRLIYATVNADAREGYVINLSDGKITPLNVPGFSFPDFISDSGEMVYHNSRIRTHIAYISLSQTTLTTPFPVVQSEFSHRNPHYSATADRLVYVSNESGFNEIWSSQVDGNERRKLTTMTTNLSSPQWSHDGKRIAFLAPNKTRQGNNLYVLNVKTRQVQKLSNQFDQHSGPAWLHDGSAVMAVATENNQSQLYAFALDGTRPRLLFNDSASFAVQTADKMIWYSKDVGEGLWQFNPKQPQNHPVQVLDGTTFRVRVSWTVTDKGLYYQHDHTDHHRINYYDFATKQVSSLLKLPLKTLGRVGSITYVPSVDKLIFNQSEYPQVDIKRLRHVLLK